MCASLAATTSDEGEDAHSLSTRAAFNSFIDTTVEWSDYFLLVQPQHWYFRKSSSTT
jgi:MFS transporter, MHS family, shikimate and dehydroshikimate transport protein